MKNVKHQALDPEPYNKTKRFAADFLGVELCTINQYVSRRQLPHIKLNNKLVRFKLSDLIRFAEKQRVA
jgi:hypothetical protein